MSWWRLRTPNWWAPEDPEAPSVTASAVEVATALAMRFEGLFLKPYLCPAGVPTIGYGATYYPNGRRVTLKDAPITKEYAMELLTWMVTTVYLPAVLKLCPDVKEAGMLAALIDFTFNLGANNLAASTLRKRVNDGRWDDAKREFMRWNKAAGKVLKGLTRRRQAEVDLI